MKTLTLITFLITYCSLFGQNSMKLYGDIQLGAGMLVKGNGLYHGTAGFNVILGNNMYLRAGGTFALGGKLTTPNSEVGYTNYGLRIGYNNEVSESFRIIPYTGIGYHSVLATTREPVEAVETANQLTGLVGVDIETRYETVNYKSFSVPVGVDFHFHNDKIGFMFGYYLLISEYTETGLRLGFTFGKQ